MENEQNKVIAGNENCIAVKWVNWGNRLRMMWGGRGGTQVKFWLPGSAPRQAAPSRKSILRWAALSTSKSRQNVSGAWSGWSSGQGPGHTGPHVMTCGQWKEFVFCSDCKAEATWEFILWQEMQRSDLRFKSFTGCLCRMKFLGNKRPRVPGGSY